MSPSTASVQWIRLLTAATSFRCSTQQDGTVGALDRGAEGRPRVPRAARTVKGCGALPPARTGRRPVTTTTITTAGGCAVVEEAARVAACQRPSSCRSRRDSDRTAREPRKVVWCHAPESASVGSTSRRAVAIAAGSGHLCWAAGFLLARSPALASVVFRGDVDDTGGRSTPPAGGAPLMVRFGD